jgi:hypothetical protein
MDLMQLTYLLVGVIIGLGIAAILHLIDQER